ncbi:MAG: hypothetical protein Q7S84_02960 [bacterium]|nr:hypothetical protein [bacterium]
MRITITGPAADSDRALLERHGFAAADGRPDVVVAFGGDGALMRAEHDFPGIPKLLLRASRICKLCAKLPNEEVLARVRDGRYEVRELPKLRVTARGMHLDGMNDVIVHNADPRHGIRYRVYVDGREVGGEIIGDGVVVATPFGSTGYYRSITDSSFVVGMGLAFNNSTEQSDHIVLPDTAEIRLVILRGPAVCYADNHRESIELLDGDEVLISKSPEIARLVVVES